MKKQIISLISIVFLAGCNATHPDAIMPQQENNKYLSYSCSNLEQEAIKISSQTIALKSQLKDDADFDGAMFAVGMLVAWPVLFAIQGDDKDTTKLYSKIKGELLNIQEADILNECNIIFDDNTLSIVRLD